MFERNRLNAARKRQAKEYRRMRKSPIYGTEIEVKDAVFLDFDGVIRIKGKLSEHCIRNLLFLCMERKLKVVVTSSWRNEDVFYSLLQEIDDMVAKCQDSIAKISFIKDLYLGFTIRSENSDRTEEILEYIASSRLIIDKFVVLDDSVLSELTDFQIVTDPSVGFSCDDCKNSIEFIDKQVSKYA